MEIIVGENAGFCYGVNRAVSGALKLLENKNEKFFCIGELVHNKIVIDDLKKRGVNFVEKLNEVTGNTIIRAHGISKESYNYLEKNKINYFDYTCPNVLNIHKIADKYVEDGYFIFLLRK